FPLDFRDLSIQEPQRREFYGNQGRHYHLFAIKGHPDTWLVAEVSEDLLVRPIRAGVIKFLIISTLFVSMLACLLTWLVSRKTVKPLKQLADLVDDVAPENMPKDFAKQFPNNELGILARTLEQSFTRITQTLEREKCFTRDVSHELRTPLAIIQNAAELYHSYQVEHQSGNAVVQRIADASLQMEKTVYTLLMLAREEHVESIKERVSFMPIIERSVLDNYALMDGKKIAINISDNCQTEVHAQPGMLKVLLDNLLSNAFRYTLEGEVNIHFKDGTLIVKDTGPGIEQPITNNVTDPAVKGSQSTSFGFGLSIVKRLCEHQNWQLTVHSDSGTCVSVYFPN
ncbi:MAG: HAMP domain-containing sensor histidine kinase, partial [Paraglaciecola sp.]